MPLCYDQDVARLRRIINRLSDAGGEGGELLPLLLASSYPSHGDEDVSPDVEVVTFTFNQDIEFNDLGAGITIRYQWEEEGEVDDLLPIDTIEISGNILTITPVDPIYRGLSFGALEPPIVTITIPVENTIKGVSGVLLEEPLVIVFTMMVLSPL